LGISPAYVFDAQTNLADRKDTEEDIRLDDLRPPGGDAVIATNAFADF
jgi:hypothetical protein